MTKEYYTKEFLSINELAEHLNMSVPWVKSQIFRKTIPYVKMGRLVMFEIKAIEKWIEERRVQEESWK